MDLWNEMQHKVDELNDCVRNLRKAGRDYADAYKQYRVLVAKELLRLKSEGMPATISYDIARGTEEVANAKSREIETETILFANKEAINSIKLQIKIIQEQNKQEWGTAKYE